VPWLEREESKERNWERNSNWGRKEKVDREEAGFGGVSIEQREEGDRKLRNGAKPERGKDGRRFEGKKKEISKKGEKRERFLEGAKKPPVAISFPIAYHEQIL